METEIKEVEQKKEYKSLKCVREAMKRYNDNIRAQNPEKHKQQLEYHKTYYRKRKEEMERLKELLQKHNIEI